MEMVHRPYNGYVITYPKIRLTSAKWDVNIASDNPNLMAKLQGKTVFDDGSSLEAAIAKAQQYIDERL